MCKWNPVCHETKNNTVDFGLLHPRISKDFATIQCCLLIPTLQMGKLRRWQIEDTIPIRFFFREVVFCWLQWELNWVSYDWITENIHRKAHLNRRLFLWQPRTCDAPKDCRWSESSFNCRITRSYSVDSYWKLFSCGGWLILYME